MHAHPGDPVTLGVCLAFGQEPGDRWGRLVGIRHGDVRAIERYIIREYAEGDGEFPTGGYRTTWLITPHDAADDTCSESSVMKWKWRRTA